MDIVKFSLGPGGVNLLSEECLSTYLDDFDFLDAQCFKATLSKGLGLAIILGSILVKVPQIINLMAAKSAEGLSLFSVVLELFPCATIIGYALASGFPFSAWGESLFMALQTMVIAFLICQYNNQFMLGVILNVLYAGLVYTFVSGALSVEILKILQMTNVPVIVVSRLIQIITNYQNGNTGQLSSITCTMLFLGGLARVFTSFQETGDLVLIINFASGATMSGIILLQLIYYRNASKDIKKE